MIRQLVLIAFAAVLANAIPSRARRDDRVTQYCEKHREHFDKYCGDKTDIDHETYAKLAKFCPAYEKHCSISSKMDDTPALPDVGGSLVVPPPLPRGGDFAALDLPLGVQAKTHSDASSAISSHRLTAAIIASCTPECTAAHCTDECKCAHTHPKVHAMCNPPSTATLAVTCQRWYDKCPMFQPVQYY